MPRPMGEPGCGSGECEILGSDLKYAYGAFPNPQGGENHSRSFRAGTVAELVF